MEDFKSSLVGKSCNLKDEIEKLPEELRKLWIERKFISFLDKFKDNIFDVRTDRRRRAAISTTDIQDRMINPVLPFLSELGYSFDNEVHKRIHERYKDLSELCDYLGCLDLAGELPRRVATSSNKYLLNILCSERKIFCTDDFMKQHLKFISDRWEEQTLKVEIEFKSHDQRDLSVSRFHGHECDLQQIALDFLDKSYIYPLSDTTFPELPGVYLIYHVGKTQLYEGSQVSPSTDYPVYVGMSKKSILRRLNTHRNNIKKANGEQTGQEKQIERGTQTYEEQTDEEGQTKEKHTDEEVQTKEEHTDEEGQTKEEHTDEEGQAKEEHTDEEGQTKEEHTDEEGQTKEEHTDEEGQTKKEHTDEEGQTEKEHTDEEGQTKEEHTDEEGQTKEEHTDEEGQTKEEHTDKKEQTKGEHTDEEGQTEEEHTDEEGQTKEEHTDKKEQIKEDHTDEEGQTKEEHTDKEGQTKEEHTDKKEQIKEDHTNEEGQTKEEYTDEEGQTKEEHTDEEGQTEKETTERETQTEEKQTEGKELSENEQTEREPQTGVKMELSDFVVRFMIVDIEHYACCIESMLIEYFSPVWNSQTVKLSFGNASKSANNWHKYHIEKDADTIRRVLDLLKICSR